MSVTACNRSAVQPVRLSGKLHPLQMRRGSQSAPGGKAPRKAPGPVGQLFLRLCQPLPEPLSVHNLLRCIGVCISAANWMLAALLIFTAPLTIPLLVWTALGEHLTQWPVWAPVHARHCSHSMRQTCRPIHTGADSKQQVVRLPRGIPSIGRFDVSGRALSLPALSAPAAFALLAAVSVSIHIAQAARQRARRRQQEASARALRPDYALQRPRAARAAPARVSTAARRSTPSGGAPMESPFSLHRRTTGLSSPDGKQQPNGLPTNGEPVGSRGVSVQPLFAQLAEIQQVVFGAETAAKLVAFVPQTFENAVFETGRLCGEQTSAPSILTTHSNARCMRQSLGHLRSVCYTCTV